MVGIFAIFLGPTQGGGVCIVSSFLRISGLDRSLYSVLGPWDRKPSSPHHNGLWAHHQPFLRMGRKTELCGRKRQKLCGTKMAFFKNQKIVKQGKNKNGSFQNFPIPPPKKKTKSCFYDQAVLVYTKNHLVYT